MIRLRSCFGFLLRRNSRLAGSGADGGGEFFGFVAADHIFAARAGLQANAAIAAEDVGPCVASAADSPAAEIGQGTKCFDARFDNVRKSEAKKANSHDSPA